MTSVGTDTRSRILEEAWVLVREKGPGEVTIAEIAAAAGVSRQLVYFHFENRAGLLVAMARHHDVRSGFVDRVAGTRSLAPEEGFEVLLREWLDYIPEILPVARALEAAIVTGDEGGRAWRDRMDDLREAFRIAVERVDRENRLAGGWTVDTATDWVWARGHLTVWQHLVGERGWRPTTTKSERSVRYWPKCWRPAVPRKKGCSESTRRGRPQEGRFIRGPGYRYRVSGLRWQLRAGGSSARSGPCKPTGQTPKPRTGLTPKRLPIHPFKGRPGFCTRIRLDD